MSAAPPITAAADQPASARALIERQQAMLAELAEIGMELARAAGRKALADSDDGGATGLDPALSYTRAARAVRLTIALQSKLLESLAALDKGELVARVGDAARRRSRIQRLVKDAAEAEGRDAHEAERLSWEVCERLTDEDDSALLDRPIQEVVAMICRDLGLSPAFAAPAFAPSDIGVPQSSSSGLSQVSTVQLPPPRPDHEPSVRLSAGFSGQARE